MKTRKWNGKYLFAKNINNSNNSGIIDVTTNSLFCWCSEDQSQIILDALNIIQKCDLMPSELLKQRDEAIRLLKEHTENGTGYTITQDDINPMLVFLSKIIEQ